MFGLLSIGTKTYAEVAYNFKFNGIAGKQINLADYENKVLIVVNVASRCGYTPQYSDLQKIWEDYTKNPSDVYDKDKNIKKISKHIRFKFDLHGFTLDEANRKVKEIIFFCREKKYKELLLITGKGIHSTSHKDTYISKDLGPGSSFHIELLDEKYSIINLFTNFYNFSRKSL